MSMIEREIERLEKLRDKNFYPESAGYQTIGDAIDTIKTQSEKLQAYAMERSSQYYHDGWIPVDERLPKNNEMVLLCTKQGYMYAGYQTGKLLWNKSDGAWIPYTVIAWRPLPEPFKETDNEN